MTVFSEGEAFGLLGDAPPGRPEGLLRRTIFPTLALPAVVERLLLEREGTRWRTATSPISDMVRVEGADMILVKNDAETAGLN